MDNNNNNSNDELSMQFQKTVEASVNWISHTVDEISQGVSNQIKNVTSSEEYKKAMEEKARLQSERQKKLQERTRVKNEMKSKFGKIDKPSPAINVLLAMALTVYSIKKYMTNNSSWEWIIGLCLVVLLWASSITSVWKRSRADRYEQYLKRIGNRDIVEISDFVDNLGLSKKNVIKDLRRMMSASILKQAHITEDQKYLILTHDAYEEYVGPSLSYNAKEAVQKLMEEENRVKESRSDTDADPELVKTLSEGRSYIEQIQTANCMIKGADITAKLQRLERNCSQIFTAVEKHPEKLPEIRKFMDYYMPTTLKLVNSYAEFDNQKIQGENIIKAKHEIEDTLDTINLAYENLSDRLFEADTMDVSADISVLKTMLAQEGLNNDDFKL